MLLQKMATDPAVTGPSVWLQLVQQEVENAGTDNAGASSNGFADPIFTDLADHSDTNSEEDLVLPSLELEMENTAIVNAGASTDDFADPTFTGLVDPSDTSSEEDPPILLPSLDLEMDPNVGTQRAGSSDEEELVLPPISVPRYFNSIYCSEFNFRSGVNELVLLSRSKSKSFLH